MDKNALFYVICVTEYFNSVGCKYQILTNKHYQRYLNSDGNVRYREYEGEVYLVDERQSPCYCDYSGSYYKFETFGEAMNKAIELVRSGVLPNLGISKEIAKYSDKKPVISILKRPLGDIVGYRYAKWLEANKDKEITNKPIFKAGDRVYLTGIENGDIIYKTKVYDCELNDENEWQYYTTYWTDYPYKQSHLMTESEFNNALEIKPSGNKYLYGQRIKIVEC